MKGKNVLKKWLPPIVFDTLAKVGGYKVKFVGDFTTWDSADKQTSGYAVDEILERVKSATLAAIENPFKSERDGTILDEKVYPFPLIAALLQTAQRDGRLTVLDFGGSLGSTYHQCKDFLSHVKELKWCIVEQRHFVDCGKELFQSDLLKFYHDVESCYVEQQPNLALFSGVLQYLDDPQTIINQVTGRGPGTIVVDRTPFLETRSHIALQIVPSRLGNASYPIRLYSVDEFKKQIETNYRLITIFPNADPVTFYKGESVTFKGMIFQKREG
jgi:putative methyltransferase (TIGR04325 family)